MSSVKYINNYIYFNNISDISINTIKSNNITTQSISVNNLTGNFKNTLDVSLSNIDSTINLIDTSLGNFYINDFIDNSFTDISNKRNDYHKKNIIDNKKNTIDNSINSITDSTYTKYEIETSFNRVNDRLDELDSSFQDVNTRLNTIDTSMQYILDNDTSFNGKKTFNGDITILGNLKSSDDFIIDGDVTISGDLVVNGTETIINSNTIDISDKTILLASNSNSLSQADGAGIEIYNKNGDNPSILYNDNSNCWNTNIGLDISGKITVKDNDFSMKVTDNSNKKLDISMSNGDCVSINGNLNVTGEISSNNINELNNRINRINNNNSIINIENINYINNDKILSKYDGSNIATDFSINNGIDITNNQYGYNIFFTSISYDDIISDVSQNGTMSNHLEKYNMIDISNLNDFICLTNYNDNTSYEVSYNKIIIKNDNKYNLNFETSLDISIGNTTFIGDYFIDIAILKFIDNSINIITSEQKNISNLDDTTIDISINNNIIDLSKNNSIGFGFLIYCQSDIYNDISGINNYYVDVNTQNGDTGTRGIKYNYAENVDVASSTYSFTRVRGGAYSGAIMYNNWVLSRTGTANNATGFWKPNHFFWDGQGGNHSFNFYGKSFTFYDGSPSITVITENNGNAQAISYGSSAYGWVPSNTKFLGVNIAVENDYINHIPYFNFINFSNTNVYQNIFQGNNNLGQNLIEISDYKIIAKVDGFYNFHQELYFWSRLRNPTDRTHVRNSEAYIDAARSISKPVGTGISFVLVKNLDTTTEEVLERLDVNPATQTTPTGYWGHWGDGAPPAVSHGSGSSVSSKGFNVGPYDIYLNKGDTISVGFLVRAVAGSHPSQSGYFLSPNNINTNVFKEQPISTHHYHPFMETPYVKITGGFSRLQLNYGHKMSLTFKKINLSLEKDISYIETLYIDNNLDINSNIIVKNDISVNDISINNLTSTNLLEVSDDVIINDICNNTSFNVFNTFNNIIGDLNDYKYGNLLYKDNDNVYIFPEFSLIIANNNDIITHSILDAEVSTLPLPKGDIYKIKGGTYLTSIGADVFEDSSNLTNVDFTNCTKLVEISNNSFKNCTNLNSVNFTNCTDLSSIGSNAFSGCSSLTNVDFSGCTNLYIIGHFSFHNTGIINLDLTDCTNLTVMFNDSFRNCSDLSSVDFTNCSSLNTINNVAFWNCPNLRSLDFSGCSSLTLSDIHDESFKECLNIQTVNITNSGLKTETNASLNVKFQKGTITINYINDTPVIYNNDIDGYEVLFNLVTTIQISSDVSIMKKSIDEQTNTQITGAGYKCYKITVEMVEEEDNDGFISQEDVEYEWTYNIYGELIEYTKVSL